jgi:hypothetical protein
LLLRNHRRFSEHLFLIDLYIQRLVVLLYSFNYGRTCRPQTFRGLVLRSTIFLILAKKILHVVLKVLVLEICNSFPPFRTLESSCFGIRSAAWCYGLCKATEALCIQGLLLMLRPSSEVIDYAVELGAHLSRIFILVFLFFFIDLIMLFRELLPLIVLKVVSRILGVTFLLLILILLIKGHLVDLII